MEKCSKGHPSQKLYGPNTHNHADTSATLAEQWKERARGLCVAGRARQHPAERDGSMAAEEELQGEHDIRVIDNGANVAL